METTRTPGLPAVPQPLSVGEFVRTARELLEARLGVQWVVGEISNFTRAASGHCYFSLKDERAQVRCVLFRQRALLLEVAPANGMLVEVRAQPTLYEARGDFQLQVDFLRPAGLGARFAALERLKARLLAEGLFDPARKRVLPAFPRRVGVVTSLAAAALRDVLTTLRRRMPGLPVVIYPTAVQGEGAAAGIAAALAAAGRRAECDVLILCRGGGSIEDLWSFNEEPVVRAVAASPVPVVSGVGHETDFTLADLAADARAPTPTAAAELVSPDARQLRARLDAQGQRAARALARALESREQRLDLLARALVHPGQRLRLQRRQLDLLALRLLTQWQRQTERQRQRLQQAAGRLRGGLPDTGRLQERLDAAGRRLHGATQRCLEARRSRLAVLEGRLHALNPLAVLERGFALVSAADGSLVRSAAQTAPGARLHLRFATDALAAQVLPPDA